VGSGRLLGGSRRCPPPPPHSGLSAAGGRRCKAAQVDHGGRDDCWYDNPRYNVSFAALCSRSDCACEAIELQAMGRETDAMCHEGRRRRLQPDPPAPPPPPPPGFWACTASLEQLCPWDQYRHDPQVRCACGLRILCRPLFSVPFFSFSLLLFFGGGGGGGGRGGRKYYR
jgi:hypothetical protein